MKQNLKAEALHAYEAALANPNYADWREVAELLRGALPTPKLTGAFGDYVIPNSTPPSKIVLPSPVIDARFADGTNVRASFATVTGKPLNVGRALRIAQAFYEARNGREAPAIVSAVIEKDNKLLARAGSDLEWETV